MLPPPRITSYPVRIHLASKLIAVFRTYCAGAFRSAFQVSDNRLTILSEWIAKPTAFVGGIRTAYRVDFMSRSVSVEDSNRRLLRARDLMDRTFAKPLRIPRLARIAEMSEAHFIRTFRATFGEAPHRYLQRRRVERAMFLLRTTGRGVTDVCFDVGFSSLGTFSRTFHDIVGETPTEFRQRGRMPAVPTCFIMAWTRPSSFGEATSIQPPLE